MNEITMFQTTELLDAKLRAAATRVAKTALLAMEKAVAHAAQPERFPIATDANTFERIFLSHLQSLPAATRQAATANVMVSVQAPQAGRIKSYGDLANVDLTAASPVEVQVNKLAVPTALKFPLSYLQSLSNTPTQVLSPMPLTSSMDLARGI